MCWVGNRLPNFFRRVAQLTDENERPLLFAVLSPILSHPRPVCRTRCVLLAVGHLFSLVFFFVRCCLIAGLIDHAPCGRGNVREHLRERTRSGGTEPARHPPAEVVQVSAGRDGAVRPPWIPRNRHPAV